MAAKKKRPVVADVPVTKLRRRELRPEVARELHISRVPADPLQPKSLCQVCRDEESGKRTLVSFAAIVYDERVLIGICGRCIGVAIGGLTWEEVGTIAAAASAEAIARQAVR